MYNGHEVVCVCVLECYCGDSVRLGDDVSPQKLLVTPVRRSTRRSCAALPAGLRDHDVIVESVDEVTADVCDRLLFRDNGALQLAWKTINTGTEANAKALVKTDD